MVNSGRSYQDDSKEERIAFSTNDAKTIKYFSGKIMNLNPYLTSNIKIHSSCVIDLNVKPKPINPLIVKIEERNHQTLCYAKISEVRQKPKAIYKYKIRWAVSKLKTFAL